MSSFLPFIIVGLVSGSVYGLAGMGLVLTYKTSGIFNLAYGALATVAAYTFYALNVQHNVPLWASLVLAVPALGLLMGVLFERFAERASRAKLAIQIAATVGLTLIVDSLAVLIFGPDTLTFPQYLFPNQSVEIGGVNVQASQIFIFSVSLAATVVLYLFLRLARVGIAMRAVVDNTDLINLAGTNPTKVRRLAWIIGCFTATLVGLLLAPSLQLDPSTLTLLVVDAFGAAALGGFSSLPLTWVGGIFLGLASAIATKYINSTGILGGLAPSLPFIVLFLAILLYPRRRLFVKPVVLVRGSATLWTAPRRFQLLAGLLVVGFLATVPAFAGFRIVGWTTALTTVILLLSLGLLVRTSGHVSLCQASFAAIGAVAFSKLSVGAGLPWLAALLLGALVVVPIGALLAIPAIRLGGLFLALATFGFGLLLQNMFYESNLMFGYGSAGLLMPRPNVGWLHSFSDTGFYYVVLAFAVLTSLLIVVIAHSRLGRLLRGLSDSPIALSASGAAVNMTHILVFCISAYIAAISGALLGMTLGTVSGLSFDPTMSLTYLALIVISVGGEPWYALLSGFGLGLVPVYITTSSITYYLQLIFGLGAVQVAMFGIAPLPLRVRRAIDRLGEMLGERDVERVQTPGFAPETSFGADDTIGPTVTGTGAPTFLPIAGAMPGPVAVSSEIEGKGYAPHRTFPVVKTLEVRDLRIRFGGLNAVDGLNMVASTGRIRGLIGPNGAGKTTTFNACSGFIRPSSGQIMLNGERDISSLGPSARARLGLGRTFQRMELFDSLTVAENVALGREASLAGANVFSQVVTRRAERTEVKALAGEAIALCEISHLLSAHAGDLSTGERRLVELARALAGPFSLLLLDEPSSGLDRNETVRFGRILSRAVEERGVGILLVEHDMSLVMDVCEYVYVMDFGKLIFEGPPVAVRASPAVQAAYLGTGDVEAHSDSETVV